MKATTTTSGGFGLSRRCLAIATLALFGHAVALHLLHGHGLFATLHAPSAAAMSTPNEAPSGEPQSGENCPACQLQHGFVFLAASLETASLEATTRGVCELAPLGAAPRRAERSTSSRAPPAI